MTKENPLLFYDLETTGIDPDGCRILEIAAVVADSDLKAIASFSTVIVAPIADVLGEMNDVVQRMHGESGLLASIREGIGMTLEHAEDALLHFLDEHSYTESIVLAGHSPHAVDLSFTKRWLPRIASRLSHRLLDTGSLVRTYQRYVDPSFRGGTVDGHRALADALGALDELKRWAAASRSRLSTEG